MYYQIIFFLIVGVAGRLADRLKQYKSVIINYFLSSNFIYIVITTIKKEGKEKARRDSNLGITKTDCGRWERVDGNNNAKVPPANRNALALADKNALAPANSDTLPDK